MVDRGIFISLTHTFDITEIGAAVVNEESHFGKPNPFCFKSSHYESEGEK